MAGIPRRHPAVDRGARDARGARRALLQGRALRRLLDAGILRAGRALRLGRVAQRTAQEIGGLGHQPHAAAETAPAGNRLCGAACGDLLAAGTLHQQHGAVLGQPHHGALHRSLLDAVAQMGRTMARMACGRCGDRRALSVQGHPHHGRALRPLFGAGRSGLRALAAAGGSFLTKAARPPEDGPLFCRAKIVIRAVRAARRKPKSRRAGPWA